MSVIVRFAPSPTGFLHIGSARTALFNWLFAKHHGGKFLLRIEDTDRQRSTPEAVDAIFESLKWLGLSWDEEPVFQFSRCTRHAEVARRLVEEGKAYYCYCTPEELENMRTVAKEKGLPPRYNGRWREATETPPVGVKPVIRFKAPQTGETIIEDKVQGRVCIQNQQLDDMVLLRADGTPTYMLSVVADDYDMGITHIIRGDDHLTNAFRQKQLIIACGWPVPDYAHIPLIHGSDGAKLSKRHGAIGTEQYAQMGILPETMRNYLLRLGWGHGDAEIISTDQAIAWFDLDHVGRSPSRLDMAKLLHLNAHYMRLCNDDILFDQMKQFFPTSMTTIGKTRILKGMKSLKERAKTLTELAESAMFYDHINAVSLQDNEKEIVRHVLHTLRTVQDFSDTSLTTILKELAGTLQMGLGKVAAPLRLALTNRTVSPSLFEIMEILGKEETLHRLETALV